MPPLPVSGFMMDSGEDSSTGLRLGGTLTRGDKLDQVFIDLEELRQKLARSAPEAEAAIGIVLDALQCRRKGQGDGGAHCEPCQAQQFPKGPACGGIDA